MNQVDVGNQIVDCPKCKGNRLNGILIESTTIASIIINNKLSKVLQYYAYCNICDYTSENSLHKYANALELQKIRKNND